MNDRQQLLLSTSEFLQQDGILLDERRWDEWLELYTTDCKFWAPMWGNETEINDDPDTTLAHFCYEDRRGIEDRILRVRAGKSPASVPLPRTAHLISNIALLGAPSASEAKLRATWACHILLPRSGMQHVFFGRTEYLLAASGDSWRIKQKKILLQNDRIPSVLDVYCV